MKYILVICLLLSGCALYTPPEVYESVRIGDSYTDVVALLGVPGYKQCNRSANRQSCTIGYRNAYYYRFNASMVVTETYL